MIQVNKRVSSVVAIALVLKSNLILSYSLCAELSPNQRAFELTQKSSHLKKLVRDLNREAHLISNSKFRKDALSILKRPEFKFMNEGIKNEKAIIQKLIQEGLLDSEFNSSLFPKELPMLFQAASGSPWLNHHSYPGGLVYHTLTNLKLGLSYVKVYRDLYELSVNSDFVRFAAIMHDSAKTVTLPWNSDGTCANKEITIAGTAAHHVFAIAEAIYRKYPSEFIVILASAHSSPLAGRALDDLVRYLRAGAILAGAQAIEAGLTEDGRKLAVKAPVEAFINHLDDHDYVFSQTTIQAVDSQMKTGSKPENHWERNRKLSEKGDFRFY